MDKIQDEMRLPQATAIPSCTPTSRKLAKHRALPGPAAQPQPAPAPPAREPAGRGAAAACQPSRSSNAVFDAGIWVDGSDPDLTMLDIRPGERARPARAAAAATSPLPATSRRGSFLTVLSKGDPDVPQGSGRLNWPTDLHRAAPLAARVIVNRVWAWHFGKPLVATPSDFGTQGEKPTHPELLDDLAARFIANGWSLKWLHREIMLSAAYRQASRPRADGGAGRPDQSPALAHESAPAGHRGVSRLPAAGRAARWTTSMGGPSADLDQADNTSPHRVRPRQPRRG